LGCWAWSTRCSRSSRPRFAIGFAGALFNPAVRAYLARDAGPRRVEVFALFNIFYQTGTLFGPLLGWR
jgi:MFS family permease